MNGPKRCTNVVGHLVDEQGHDIEICAPGAYVAAERCRELCDPANDACGAGTKCLPDATSPTRCARVVGTVVGSDGRTTEICDEAAGRVASEHRCQ